MKWKAVTKTGHIFRDPVKYPARHLFHCVPLCVNTLECSKLEPVKYEFNDWLFYMVDF
jgi:hypothetical protein